MDNKGYGVGNKPQAERDLAGHRRFFAAIGEGLAVVNAGRVRTTQELKKSFEAEFGPIAW